MTELRTRSLAAITGLGLVAALTVAVAPAAEAATSATGQRCTIVGTAGNDRLTGTPRNDVICGLGGNDVITGLGGNDVLDGGAGNDTIDGGPGRDTVTGGAGNDLLWGSAGSDTLVGGAGTDTVTYADRRAPVTADLDGARDDGVTGENDQIGTDVENLVGGSGSDVLTGSAAANAINGGLGADLINGGAGSDRLGGGAGSDTVTYADRSAPVAASLDGVGNDGESGEHDAILADVENLVGGTGDDSLSGDGGSNALAGGAGDDTVVGGGGSDTLTGGAGDDQLQGGGGSDSLDGGLGANSCDQDDLDLIVLACLSDATPPSVLSIDVLDTKVDLTDGPGSLGVSVRVADDLSGPVSVGVGFVGPSSGRGFAVTQKVSGNRRDSVWRGTWTVPVSAPAGAWRVGFYWAMDAGGNSVSGQLTLPDGSHTFEIVGGMVPDVTPPVISAVSLDPTSVDVTGQAARIHATVHVTDDVSDIEQVDVYIGDAFGAAMKQTAPGIWEGDGRIPADAPSGAWRVQIMAVDASGNVSEPLYRQIDVRSDNPDVLPPLPTAIQIMTPVVSKVVSTEVRARVTVHDQHLASDNSGHVALRWCRPDGQMTGGTGISRLVSTSDDGQEAVYELTGWVPAAAPRGIYTVCQVQTQDIVGNSAAWLPLEAWNAHPTWSWVRHWDVLDGPVTFLVQ